MRSSTGVAAPWQMWAVGVVMLFLYGIGAYDYVLTRTGDEAYFASLGYGPHQIAYFTDYPLVPLVFWAVNIATGLAAAVLLLLRFRWAAGAALVATVSQLCLQVITFGFMDRWAALGPRLSIQDIVVLLLTAGLWLYARRLRARGVLT